MGARFYFGWFLSLLYFHLRHFQKPVILGALAYVTLSHMKLGENGQSPRGISFFSAEKNFKKRSVCV